MKKLIVLLFVLFVSTISVKAQTFGQGLQVGDKAPDFTLSNQNGEQVNLYELLKTRAVVITWYRGGWCPFCNVAIKELSDNFSAFSDKGAYLLALTPELPDKALSTSEKNDIKFQVLSDLDNNVAKQFGITFKLDEKTAERYESGFGLSEYNGNNDAELPIPATYIIDQEGIIRFAYVNPDYRHRVTPSILLKELSVLEAERNNEKLVVMWTSDDPMVAKRVALMYTHASKRAKIFEEVILVIWGPSAKLIAENTELQAKIKTMQADGVIVKACIACANEYGVTEDLKKLGYEVLPMRQPLSDYLKKGYNMLNF